jgi:hypothetical protein
MTVKLKDADLKLIAVKFLICILLSCSCGLCRYAARTPREGLKTGMEEVQRGHTNEHQKVSI